MHCGFCINQGTRSQAEVYKVARGFIRIGAKVNLAVVKFLNWEMLFRHAIGSNDELGHDPTMIYSWCVYKSVSGRLVSQEFS